MTLVRFVRIVAWTSLALNGVALVTGLLGLLPPSDAQMWRYAFFAAAALLTLEWIRKDSADVR